MRLQFELIPFSTHTHHCCCLATYFSLNYLYFILFCIARKWNAIFQRVKRHRLLFLQVSIGSEFEDNIRKGGLGMCRGGTVDILDHGC